MKMPRAGRIAAWSLLLVFETVCQISLKLAGRVTGAFDFSPDAFVRALGVPWLYLAIACYVGAFLAWMTILRQSTLSAAFTTSALVFVAVMLSSWLVFGEHIGALQLLGSAIIVGGILLLGADDGKAQNPPFLAGKTPESATFHPRDPFRARIPSSRSHPTMSSVQETIFGIISKEAGIDINKITLDSTLKELEIQSLDAVQIIFELEDHFKITLPDRDPNFDTESVRGLVDAVEKLVAEKAAAGAPAAQG